MLPVLTVLTLLTKKHKFWDKELAGDDSVDEWCDMLLMLTVLTLQTKRDKFWDKVEAKADNVDGCCYMLLLWWLVLTDVDESLFSRILVYFVVKISTHLDLGYATGAIVLNSKKYHTDRILAESDKKCGSWTFSWLSDFTLQNKSSLNCLFSVWKPSR